MEIRNTDLFGARNLSASAISGNGEVRWYENDGATSPSFTAHVVPTTAIDFFALWAGDVDGDGDKDLITANGPSGSSTTK